jgi:cation diffusion facilitator family transporter
MAIKFIGGIISGSAGLIADAVHSLSDFASDILIIVSAKISQKPKDHDHPYGHSKVETIASFILGILLGFVGLNIGYNSIKSIINWFNGETFSIKTNLIFWIIIALSIIGKEILYQITIRKAKKHNNDNLKANAWHHRSDSLSSISVLIGALIVHFTGFEIADSIAAIIVSIMIIKVAWEILYSSGNTLIDTSADNDTLDKIKDITLNTNGVLSINSLKTRKIGNGVLMECDIEVRSNITVDEGHTIAENVKVNIMNNIEDIRDVLVHVEPYKNS